MFIWINCYTGGKTKIGHFSLDRNFFPANWYRTRVWTALQTKGRLFYWCLKFWLVGLNFPTKDTWRLCTYPFIGKQTSSGRGPGWDSHRIPRPSHPMMGRKDSWHFWLPLSESQLMSLAREPGKLGVATWDMHTDTPQERPQMDCLWWILPSGDRWKSCFNKNIFTTKYIL